jgi:hypothetical protein
MHATTRIAMIRSAGLHRFQSLTHECNIDSLVS